MPTTAMSGVPSPPRSAPTAAPSPQRTRASTTAQSTRAPDAMTVSEKITESLTTAPCSTTTPGPRTERSTRPSTRAPGEIRLSTIRADPATRAGSRLLGRDSTGQSGSSSRIGGSGAIRSMCPCQKLSTVPTSRQ